MRLVRFCAFGRHITVETEISRTDYAHCAWNLPDSAVTPEAYYLRRRQFLRAFGFGLAASALLPPAIGAECWLLFPLTTLQIARVTKAVLTKAIRSYRILSVPGAITTPP